MQASNISLLYDRWEERGRSNNKRKEGEGRRGGGREGMGQVVGGVLDHPLYRQSCRSLVSDWVTCRCG